MSKYYSFFLKRKSYLIIVLIMFFSIVLQSFSEKMHVILEVSENQDLDSDNDGILNSVEDFNLDGDNDASTNPNDSDQDGIPDYLDVDSDKDGILDNVEAQLTSEFVAPSGLDVNNNGLDDVYEGAYGFGINPINSDGALGGYGNVPDYLDIDSDIDGIRDLVEAQVYGDPILPWNIDANNNGLDDAFEQNGNFGLTPINSDNDSYPDFRDFDSDNDGIKDKFEAQLSGSYIPPIGDRNGNDIDDAYEVELYPIDSDKDGIPDFRDIDTDNDGILDNIEAQNFDSYVAPSGNDNNRNGLDDAYAGGLIPINSDSDILEDFRDIDSDDDGIPDNIEGQPTEGYVPPSGEDTDNDGLDDAYEGSGNEGITPEDTDQDGTPDYLDDDSDNDLVPDSNEGHDFDYDGEPDNTYTGVDTDNDGLDDGYEGSDVNDGYDVNDEIEDPANDLPDTDETEDVNYRDLDDDGDGIDTPDEDANGDGDPTNDDWDSDGTPDYLDPDLEPSTTDPEKIEVNQLLTPNGDDKNEFLFIRNVDKAVNNNLQIYNRWGVLVYDGKNYNNVNNTFDGRSRGRSTLSANDYLPAGIYYYIFEYDHADSGEHVVDSSYLYISK